MPLPRVSPPRRSDSWGSLGLEIVPGALQETAHILRTRQGLQIPRLMEQRYGLSPVPFLLGTHSTERHEEAPIEMPA